MYIADCFCGRPLEISSAFRPRASAARLSMATTPNRWATLFCQCWLLFPDGHIQLPSRPTSEFQWLAGCWRWVGHWSCRPSFLKWFNFSGQWTIDWTSISGFSFIQKHTFGRTIRRFGRFRLGLFIIRLPLICPATAWRLHIKRAAGFTAPNKSCTLMGRLCRIKHCPANNGSKNYTIKFTHKWWWEAAKVTFHIWHTSNKHIDFRGIHSC